VSYLPPDSLARALKLKLARTRRNREAQSKRRLELYRTDPLWRLSKLKDNRERRLRARSSEQPQP
jgi:hypothetical protein